MNEFFQPELSHRFLVTFFIDTGLGGLKLPSPIDLRFQRVSGINREMSLTRRREGGLNTSAHYFPEEVTHSPLTFERGVMTVTPLTLAFNDMLSEFKVIDIDIVIMLLNERHLPVSCWVASGATATRWQTADLDANTNSVLMNTLEFTYRDIQWLGVKA